MGSGGRLEHFERGAGLLVQVRVEVFSSLEHGIETLDGGDADLGDGVDAVRLQVLDVVELGEEAPVVGRAEGLEFFQGLTAEVGAVDEEENPQRAGKLDQTIEKIAGGVGFARAGGHLDERAATSLAEGVFEVVDGGDLGGAQAGLDQGWDRLETCFWRRARVG